MVTARNTSTKDDLVATDAAHAWHPFTQATERLMAPHLQMDRGEGNWLFDVDGNRYFDGTASLWTNVRGHGNVALNDALKTQLGQLAHSTYLGLAHPPATMLAQKLASIAPDNLEITFFSDNGSCAVEVALKMSLQFWQLTGREQKRKVAAMAGAYHGDTFGAMSVGEASPFTERFRPWCFDVERFSAPDCVENRGIVHKSNATQSIAELSNLLKREGPRLAAVILEPSVQGVAGMKQQPPGFLSEVAALCKKADVHLILDEVFVAFGRLGTMLICGEEGVQPDFLCLAKGLTGGYLPLAATMTTNEISAAFAGPHHEHLAFYHGHTFTANPLAAAVALRNVELLEQDLADGVITEGINAFSRWVEDCFSDHPCVKEVRQRGLACCLDLCPANCSDEKFPVERRVGLEVCLEARKQGVLLRPLGNAIPVIPPILVQPDESEFLCLSLQRAIDAILAS